jgi:hypothetical protein
MFEYRNFIKMLDTAPELVAQRADKIIAALNKTVADKEEWRLDLNENDECFEDTAVEYCYGSYVMPVFLTYKNGTFCFTNKDETNSEDVSILYTVIYSYNSDREHKRRKEINTKVTRLRQAIRDITFKLYKFNFTGSSIYYKNKSEFEEFIELLDNADKENQSRIERLIQGINNLDNDFSLVLSAYNEQYDENKICYGLRYDNVSPVYLTYYSAENTLEFTAYDCTDNENVSILYTVIYDYKANRDSINRKLIESKIGKIIEFNLDVLNSDLSDKFCICEDRILGKEK